MAGTDMHIDDYDTLTDREATRIIEPDGYTDVGHKNLIRAVKDAYRLGQQHERERPKCLICGRAATTQRPGMLAAPDGSTHPAHLCWRCDDGVKQQEAKAHA